MEERKSIPQIGIMLYVLKQMPIRYELVQESDGSYSSWTQEGIITHGTGLTESECLKDLLSGLKDMANQYIEDFEDWYKHNPSELGEVIKLLNSTDEELYECLTRMN